jgi:hypothetical protein
MMQHCEVLTHVPLQASGNVGSGILKALLAHGYNVQVLTRADSTSTFPGVSADKVIRGDFNDIEFYRSALKGQDALVLATGSAALDAQKDIMTAAAEVGVKRIIPSEFGSVSIDFKGSTYYCSALIPAPQDLEDEAALNAIPFNQGKVDIANHLKSVVAAHPETKWTGVTCGPFFDWVRGAKSCQHDRNANGCASVSHMACSKSMSRNARPLSMIKERPASMRPISTPLAQRWPICCLSQTNITISASSLAAWL